MRKFKPEVVIVRRLRDGPRRARSRMGRRVVVFFLVTAVLTGALAIALNLQLEDRLISLLSQRTPSNPL
jgi:hypothetical protein